MRMCVKSQSKVATFFLTFYGRRRYDKDAANPYDARHFDDDSFGRAHGRHGAFSERQGASDYGHGTVRAVGGACRAQPMLVRVALQGSVSAVPRHAAVREHGNWRVRIARGGERHADGVVRASFVRNRLCTRGAPRRLALVLPFYVRPHRHACRTDGRAARGGTHWRTEENARPADRARARVRLRHVCVRAARRVGVPFPAAAFFLPRRGKRIRAVCGGLCCDSRAVRGGGALCGEIARAEKTIEPVTDEEFKR